MPKSGDPSINRSNNLAHSNDEGATAGNISHQNTNITLT